MTTDSGANTSDGGDNQNSKRGDILIVDDQIENIQFLSTMLMDNGYEVRQVLSGKQALYQIRLIAHGIIKRMYICCRRF
ncbi:hypothetical protein WEU38_00595 [Cyanobacterium aponinum AL20118]|uniref:Response regulatory domain-containing protein n=1 Tax=Cyanobacterium aponinum AL20115 TaxID=3090662 RepID=A0AAF0ZAU3_9CHRO|nr:hypothetical protein [Cyanobacterium aponinum]WPF88806.1 hypothetical protein SAY89_00600 [Cyanobacterium aponinum AL20115]